MSTSGPGCWIRLPGEKEKDGNVITSEEIGGLAVDLDNHYYEPLDAFSRHIEPKFRDMAIEPKDLNIPEAPGMTVWTMGDQPMVFMPPGMPHQIMSPAGAVQGIFTAKAAEKGNKDTATEWLTGLISPLEIDYMVDRDARIKVLDEQGIQATMMLPSVGVLVEWEFRNHQEALLANLVAFNKWQEEDWGYGGTDQRIFSAPMLSLLDVDWAVKELERAAALGAKFFYLPCGPFHSRSPGHPSFDKFWAKVVELDMTMIYHLAGKDPVVSLYGDMWGENGKLTMKDYSPLQHFFWGERAVSDSLATLVLNNLFGRFPQLQVICIELGSSWVRPLINKMDKAVKVGARGTWPGGQLEDLPSQVFCNHVSIVPYPEDDIPDLIDVLGIERVLFGSDYPHPEGFAWPLDFATELLSLGPEAVRKIMYDNAAALLGVARR